jgi:homocysteine S-methyltransferase
MNITEAISAYPAILAEGAVIERLRRDPTVELDPDILHSGFITEEAGRRRLRAIYHEYLSIGRAAGLPMVLLSPTWRANSERLRRSPFNGHDVNGEAVRFLREMRSGCGGYAARVWIGGLIGVRGDSYKPEEALDEAEAFEFHAEQLGRLAAAAADFLLGSTLPALSEAKGIARAMAATGLPYFPSFIIGAGGRLLDGTPLGAAMAAIDGDVSPRPLGYMMNCVHHSAVRAALAKANGPELARLVGLQANTSALSPDQLDGLEQLDSEPAEAFGSALAGLHRDFGLRILGGCCGSDSSHIGNLAQRLPKSAEGSETAAESPGV